MKRPAKGAEAEEAGGRLPAELFITAADGAPHPMAILDRAGTFVYVNRRLQRILQIVRLPPHRTIHDCFGVLEGEAARTFADCWARIWDEDASGRPCKGTLQVGKGAAQRHTWTFQFLRLDEAYVLLNLIDITHAIRSEERYRRLLETLNRRNTQLQATAEVAKTVSRILNPQQLMEKTVQLIQKRFDALYAAIFLVAEESNDAVLYAASGEQTGDHLRHGHHIPLDTTSTVGWTITQAKARVYRAGEHSLQCSTTTCLTEDAVELVLPLISRGRCIGALTMQRAAEDAMDGGDIAILQTMADHLAVAIENARLFKAAQQELAARRKAEAMLLRRNRKLNLLNRANRTFLATLDSQHLLHNILLEVKHLLDVEAASIWLVDEENGEVVCREAYGPYKNIVHGWRLKVGQGFVGWVVQHRKTLLTGNAAGDSRHYPGIDALTRTMHSALTVPLQVQQRVIGALQVLDHLPHRFDEDDRTLLESIAITVAMALENSRLYEQARQDAMTKSILLREVNHRVKNNLMAIIGLLYAEERHAKESDQAAFHEAMQNIIQRLQGLATVHSLLSASDWAPLPLSKLIRQIAQSTLRTIPRDRIVTLRVGQTDALVTPDQAHNLSLIINEIMMNTIRHALGDRKQVSVDFTITADEETITIRYHDSGEGFAEDVLQQQRFNVGLELVNSLVRRSLKGQIELSNDDGAVITITLPNEVPQTP